MKKLFLTLGFAISVFAFETNAKGFTGVSMYSGIVTPDVATGVRLFQHYNNDTNGDMVVCQFDDYSRGDCKGKGWIPVRQVVPAGKTYIGFRIAHTKVGSVIEIYWK